MYQIIKDSNSIKRIADGAFIPADPANMDYAAYLAWVDAGNTPEPAPVEPLPTQFELDQRRYQKRAAVQSELIAWMAADNMSRVRSDAYGDLSAIGTSGVINIDSQSSGTQAAASGGVLASWSR